MSWINEIAGKAENFLNKIDSSAANVLNKEKKKKHYSKTIYVDEIREEKPLNPTLHKSLTKVPFITGIAEEREAILHENSDDKLLKYLNSSSIDIDSLQDVTVLDELPYKKTKNIIVKVDDCQQSANVNLEKENEMLKNEVRSLSSEVMLLMDRTKSSEREMVLSKTLLTKKEGDNIVQEKQIALLNRRITDLENDNTELFNENLNFKKSLDKTGVDQTAFDTIEAKLSNCQLEAQRKEESLKSDIASLRIRVGELEQSHLKDRCESSKEISEANMKIHEARKELDDFRTKAYWALNEKDKLINELKKQRGDTEAESLVTLELQQSCEQNNKLKEELEETRKKLEKSRKAELEAEKRLETVREEAVSAFKSSHSRLAEETARRLAAEEHSTSHAEELHSVREELWRQVGSLNSRLKERDRELSRLRRQLSERIVARPDPEVTVALVRKQEAIEHLTVELSQLKLQLERVKASSGDDFTHRQSLYANDTDDAKAQFPSFMIPTRSMTKAYGCVKAISNFMFLRRHPFARTVLFCYLVILHLWLCLVLFFNTPDSRIQF